MPVIRSIFCSTPDESEEWKKHAENCLSDYPGLLQTKVLDPVVSDAERPARFEQLRNELEIPATVTTISCHGGYPETDSYGDQWCLHIGGKLGRQRHPRSPAEIFDQLTPSADVLLIDACDTSKHDAAEAIRACRLPIPVFTGTGRLDAELFRLLPLLAPLIRTDQLRGRDLANGWRLEMKKAGMGEAYTLNG